MNPAQPIGITPRRRTLAAVALVALSLTGCSHVTAMLGHRVTRPAATEFGLGPRSTASGRYVVTLNPEQRLKPRQMQTIHVTIADADGRPVEGAAVTIDGGMPQHGHGLPTRPRVTRSLGEGVYDIEGVRFNMGGWWEFKVAIATPAGPDVVTFNLDL